MKGLELAESFYEEFGKAALDGFTDIKRYLAVGLCGSGSECFGFDDEISTDHDFEAGFAIFIPPENIVSRRDEFLLERAYYKLPKEFRGVKRNLLSPVGEKRKGVIRTADFFIDKTGTPNGELSVKDWLTIPEFYLAEATNGKIFTDYYGEVTAIRNRLEYYPEDIRLKKLAGRLLLAAQSGQYNYSRCVRHGEEYSAQLALNEFVDAAIKTKFLLSKKYSPFYKWTFRALRGLNGGEKLSETLGYLLTTSNDDRHVGIKEDAVRDVSLGIVKELKKQNIVSLDTDDLEKCAYAVNDSVADGEIRNLNILVGV